MIEPSVFSVFSVSKNAQCLVRLLRRPSESHFIFRALNRTNLDNTRTLKHNAAIATRPRAAPMPIAPNMYDSHMHTPLCKHARGNPPDYAAQAMRVGLRGITFTCHSPMPFGWNPAPRMSDRQLPQYIDMVAAARSEYAERVDVRLGMECDYLPGFESWLEDLLRRADFSYILGSVHPLTDEYKQMYLVGATRLEYEASYFDNLARAAEAGLFDCLSHPDIVKVAHPREWDVADQS